MLGGKPSHCWMENNDWTSCQHWGNFSIKSPECKPLSHHTHTHTM